MRKLKTQEWIAVVAGIVVVAALLFGGTIWKMFSESFNVNPPSSGPVNTIQPKGNPPQDMKNISTTAGLEIYDEVVGTGTTAVSGKRVSVHYVGVLKNGTKFDSSIDRGQPFTFDLGTGQVIKGWDVGVAGMKIGGTRRLVISPELGYGSMVNGPIPANSTLIFQVQLLGVN